MKTLPVTFGIAFFAVAIISASALTDASALMDDGTLTKYAPNGKYKGDMSWEPAGEIVPGQNYDFTFTISNSLTEKQLQVSNLNLNDDMLLIACTEMTTKKDIDKLVMFLKKINK